MLTQYSIKDLYALALAEGEGMGTAYEYYAKRRLLKPWLKQQTAVRSILIAGLPERYGLSLDFLLLATELGAAVTIASEHPESFDRLLGARELLLREGLFRLAEPEAVAVSSLADLPEVAGRFDLALTSEVLQRLTAEERRRYAQRLAEISSAVAMFAPNADNAAHTNRSGLSGVTLAEMQQLTGRGSAATGYIDMPPFPPGITRSDEERERATTGTFESAVMWGLGQYVRGEAWLPTSVRRAQSHIVYALRPASGR